MTKKRLVIRDGVVTGFADEVSFDGLDVAKVDKQRVSHVLPASFVKRVLFVVLRLLVGEQGRVANWTRQWSGDWLVVIDRHHYGPFTSRAQAINFEKNKIYTQGKLG